MSWISEIGTEINNLDFSSKSLRKFGITVGTVLCIIFGIMFWQEVFPSFRLYLIGFGIFLIIFGLLFPKLLTHVYRVWMALAIMLGWIVSSIILIFLFYLVLTPIGLIAKIFKKKFMDLEFTEKKDSYWIEKDSTRKIDYEKMY